MESSHESQNEKSQNTKESFEETKRKLRKAVRALQKMKKEGKDQNDPKFKEIEDQIVFLLNVAKETWANKGQTLKDLIEYIYSNLNALESSSFSKENISDEDVLKSASGGLCLQGVYKSGNVEDLLERRQQLIEIPESFSLSGPEQSEVYEQKEFSSHKSQSDFQKAMERLGFSFTSFSFENTTEVKSFIEEEKSNDQPSEQSHICCMAYNYIPLASSSFDKQKLKLLDGAIQELQEIETILLNSNDQEVLTERVLNFFKRFGSHVNQGPIHFGGVFWWRASAEGFKTSELPEVKSLTSDALNVYIGALCSGLSLNFSAGATTTSTQLKGALQRNHNEALMSQVCLSIQKTGGPAHIDDHYQWKSHLVTSKKTWSVIDRGTTFVPVWEIIMAAHSDVFQDAYSLATYLKRIFCDVTNQTEEELEGQCGISSNEQRASKLKATCTVTHSLNTFCQTLQDGHHSEAELLFLSSIDALGYCCESKTFNHLLDGKEINFLQNMIELYSNLINLLKQLGLSDLFPKKIKLNDILAIDHLSMHLNQPDTVEDLKSQYLYKLMILDYNVRYLSVKPVGTDPPLEDDDKTIVDFDDWLNTEEEPTRQAEVADRHSHIHPMDIHMAVFHCANDFLRQYIYTNLSACQFALPFLVPNPCTEDLEFPLWPLRHIKKSWQSTSADNPGKYQTRQMFSTPVPVVSFLRLGTSFTSKSQILNSVISKQRHNVFFNRHCKGSGPNSVLMNGVVEIAWYCPGGKKDDIFDDCVAFLNLHGDAKDHQLQLQFLQAVSTVNVLLLSEQPQDEETKTICQNLFNSPISLICLFSESERVPGSKNPLKVKLAAKNRNEAELTEELITNIKQCIGKYNKKQSIENCSNEARKLKFKVDEDKQSFKDGHALAQTLVCLLKEKSISDIKKEFLPLHGELWHNWCLKNKQQFRLSCKTNETIEQQKSVILSDMKATRQKQREIALSLNDFMRSFLDCLTSSHHSEDTRFYMLQWLRVLLDELSSDDLARLEENYHSTWSQMKNVSKTKEKAEELDTLRKQLNSISEKMAASTIGLQHIMREVGQMYECSVRQSVGALPALGAEMLISGYPLELMDGDESHVPLIWIQAVLKSLIDKLGDKKVYVLSILGLQSSGKSTLLNTMFGLQFAVSAGRCTRGAFMQMMKVEENIREELGFDLLLVVDTEGLRSPELSTKTSLNHDNELATFIIGIGDMTVINIMGENPSEMHEILQICVQAFLRMKGVEIKPSCIFVHQNVAEALAGDKNMEGRRRLQEKLDEMAQTAAKEEGIDNVYSFSDVIQFDLESQVFYFKNLLEGDPPMAPPNPSYSQNVQDLKTKLLSVAKWRTGFRFPSLSEFRLRVQDLWNALLQENFVFSFRNTLEIMVYSSLEEKYAQWSWKLRKYSLETQTMFKNQIGSNKILDVNTTNLFSDFDEVYTALKREIEAYFKEDKHAEILIKWKGNVENRLESLKNELIEETQKQCKMLIEVKRSMTELDQKKSDYEKNLMLKSKTMATSLKDKRLSDKQVEEAFSSLWVEWVAEIAKDQPPYKPVNIKAIVEEILYSRFKKQPDMFNKIKTISENGTFEFTKIKHISQSVKGWFKETFGKGIPQELAEKLHQNVKHMVVEYIRKKELEKTDFTKHFIYEILDEIESHIQEFEHKESVKFTYEYRVDLSVLVCLSSVQRFQKMHESFKKANNPITYLQSKRDQYLQMFRNYCKGANSVTIFAEFLFKNILPAVEEAIYNKTKVQIADNMKCNNPAFNGNRCNLENHILRHLADQEEFKSYTEYINNPKLYFKSFIGEHVETFCKDYKKLQDMFNENLKEIKSRISHISTEVCDEVNLKNGNASMWLDHFCKKLGDHMDMNRESLTSIQDEDIGNTEFLKEMMAKYLEEVVKSENMENVDASSQHLYLLKEKIKEILYEQLEGCWAQCPFCRAICTNTICNHSGDHRVQFHRSGAIGHCHYNKTDEFSPDFCSTKVCSDLSFLSCASGNWIPYKSYRDGGDPYDKWSITADGSTQGYWKWFICRFQKEWEDRCRFKFIGRGAIPDSWKEFTKESVLEELNIRD